MAVFPAIGSGRHPNSYLAINVAGSGDVTLTTDQCVPLTLEFAGALTGNMNILMPLVAADKGLVWCIYNNTSGAYTLTLKSTSGTGVSVAQGKRMLCQWDGTNVVALINDVAAYGAAARGANSDITALTGITSGITASGGANITGGLNLSGALQGLESGPAMFTMGAASQAFATDANQTAPASVYSRAIIKCTGSGPTATRDLILPLTAGAVVQVWNALGVAQSIRVIGASGTGITIANNRVAKVYCDGTNYNRLTADSVLT